MNRSRAELGWECASDFIAQKNPEILILPGNPDMRKPLDMTKLNTLLAPTLRYLRCMH